MKDMKTQNYDREQQLKKELRVIQQAKQLEINKIIYPQIKNRYEGKFFKTRNSYGKGNWWLYKKVEKIELKDVYDTGGNGITSHYSGFSFQTDPDGNISVLKTKYDYIHSLGEEITTKEFNVAWNKMVDNLNKL